MPKNVQTTEQAYSIHMLAWKALPVCKSRTSAV